MTKTNKYSSWVVQIHYNKYKMADGRHLEKSKIGHISANVRPIGTKFSLVMHIGPSNQIGS